MTNYYFDMENENGFFSVYFFLITAYIYACKTNQKLIIKDDKWKFKYINGLNDYFELPSNVIQYSSMYSNYKKLTHMIEPEYKPTLLDYSNYIKKIYNIKHEFLNNYNLPKKYNSIFIRGGDKLLYESVKYPASLYINALHKLNTGIKELFIHSDDNVLVDDIIMYINNNNIDFNTYKITNSTHNGGAVIMKRLRYGNCSNIKSVDEMDSNEIYNHTTLMLNAIEIIRKSENVIVSYDSNVSRFIKLYCDCNVVDINNKNIDYNSTRNPAYGFI